MIMDTWDDEDIGGLSVQFEYELVQTIYGSVEYKGGPPLEPDEHIYKYTVEKVILYDVTLNRDDLELNDYYEDEEDMAADVSEKVSKAIQDKMGINPFDRSVPQDFGNQSEMFNKKRNK